ncbi:hypothetical protein [Streptomyces celluloflavus]|uniref:hypothetical protein n=1 Tax=Streptomyces celluloflavus TaxID=58344 RepID=UPI00364D7840
MTDAKKLNFRQESAPVGNSGDGGSHPFMLSLRTDPLKQTFTPGEVLHTFKAPTGWKWVDYVGLSYYTENPPMDHYVGLIDTSKLKLSENDTVLTFRYEPHLNTAGQADFDHLVYHLIATAIDGATKGMSSDGYATIGETSSKAPLPVKTTLYGIITS